MEITNRSAMKIKTLILLFLASASAFAQETLSLSDAVRLSLERNYDIKIENRRVDISENNNNWGEAGRWPSISLDLNQNNGMTDNVKTASPFQLQDLTISNSLSPGVSVNWNLFNGFKVNMSKRRLEQLQRESSGNADIVVANTIQAVILGYYRAVLERDRLEEFEKQLQLSRDKWQYVKVKSELGSAVSSDLLLEENNYLNDSTNFINQEMTYRKAIRDLTVLLGEPDPTKVYDLSGTLTADREDYLLSDLYEKMTSRNVDLRKQYITQAVRNADTQVAKADRLPTLTFSPGFTHTSSRVDLSNASFPDGQGGFVPGPTQALTAISDNYSANFRVSFTLFNGGRIKRAIQNAVIQEDIALQSTEKMKMDLYRDLANSLDQYNVRKQILSIDDRKLEVAQQNMDIASEKFRNGTINSFDFRTVQNNQLSAAMQRLSSLYNLIDSHVSLLRLTGGIIETYND